MLELPWIKDSELGAGTNRPPYEIGLLFRERFSHESDNVGIPDIVQENGIKWCGNKDECTSLACERFSIGYF